ncbi:MAG TPA: penicillin-binding transpeptidase domain-containing protein [Acidimicrobiia bacterium]
MTNAAGLSTGELGRACGRRGAVACLVAATACGSSSHATAPTTTTARRAPAVSSIDRAVQRAAELALGGVGKPADLVAMRASTGEILAYASRGGLPADDALTARYPTGSTFKLVTATALLEHGFTPATAVTCPGSVSIGGTVVSNFGGHPQSAATLAQAFAQSCNTAFATLGARLANASFTAAATELGLGATIDLGRPAFTGSVVAPISIAERAVVASDGGATVVSPLALATVAATVDSGRLHAVSLVAVGAAAQARGQALRANVVAGLRSMMAAAVETGTASGQGLPQGTHAKTGTAEFAGGKPSRTVYAWLVGYRGDVAFAVLVVGGAEGGLVAGPIAARFLDRISAIP